MLLHFMERKEKYMKKMIRYEKVKKEIDEVDIN